MADDILQRVDQVFEDGGGDDRGQINAAVGHQQVDLSQIDRLVDDALLHLQRQDVGKDRQESGRNQSGLKQSVAAENPMSQGFSNDIRGVGGHDSIAPLQCAGFQQHPPFSRLYWGLSSLDWGILPIEKGRWIL